jgi:hypothetical protein
MNTLLVICLLLASPDSTIPWGELSLSIERDHSTSSDHLTICRVRVVNHGSRTWPGNAIRFEARAIDQGTVVAREAGRFGLSLVPYGTLETLIGFVGRYDRFEVVPAGGGSKARRSRGDGARRRRKAPSGRARGSG